MEEALKDKLILVLAILVMIFFVWNIASCSNVFKFRKARDKEMITRLELEEKLNKLTQDKTLTDNKLAAANKELQEEKAAHQAVQKALSQEQLLTQSLKEELQKVVKLKEALEEDLKEALVGAKQTKNK
jgi:preprotein translocase subunit SecF